MTTSLPTIRLYLPVFLGILLLGFTAAGCQGRSDRSPAPAEQSSPETVGRPTTPPGQGFSPFVIYSNKGSRDNHFVPSGFMPNGRCLEFNDAWREACYEGHTCMRIFYDVECSSADQKWAGIYWLNPADNWGSRRGGFNLTGAGKLTFWARGEVGGERIEEFKIGGITGNYPDTDTAVIGPVILSNEWRQYTIDLRGKDLSYISGGFSWATNVDVNHKNCIFYLDQIQYE